MLIELLFNTTSRIEGEVRGPDAGTETRSEKRGVFQRIFGRTEETGAVQVGKSGVTKTVNVGLKIEEMKESAKKSRDDAAEQRGLATFFGGIGVGAGLCVAVAAMAGAYPAAGVMGVLTLVSLARSWLHRRSGRRLEADANREEALAGMLDALAQLRALEIKNGETGGSRDPRGTSYLEWD